MRRSRLSDRSVIGLLLVALGVMFLIDTTGAWGRDIDVVGTYWPVLLIAWALWSFAANGFALRLWPAILLLVGALFLLSNLGLWGWGFGELWPVLLVVIGLAMLFGSRVRRQRRRSGTGSIDGDGGEATTHGAPYGDFRSSHVFGGGKEMVTSQEFQGGEISAIFGGMELDLREAGLAGGEAVIDATVVCGGIELRVPRDWQVNIQTTTLFGGTESKRSQPSADQTAGRLIITGTVLCGGIEIKD